MHAVVPEDEVAALALKRATAIADLSSQAARINKRSLRQMMARGPTTAERAAHFSYADSAEHVEGVTAFIEKRTPRFDRS